MATNWPQGDLVGWRINTKHFRQGKPLEFLPWMKNSNLHMPAVGSEPMTSGSQ